MRVENFNLNNYNTSQCAPKPKGQVQTCANSPKFETSLYSQKGLTIPFGINVKGSNKVEEDCIKLFRKVWDGRKGRKYDEFDIAGFMTHIKEGREKHDPRELIKQIFDVYDYEMPYTMQRRPEASTLNAILKVTKGLDEDECFGVLEFATHELRAGAVSPMESLANLPDAQRAKIMPLLTKINRVDNFDFVSDAKYEENVFNLYEELRSVIYAAEELPTLTAEGKLQYLSDVRSCVKSCKANDSDYKTPEAKDKTVQLTNEIYETIQDILL